MHQNFGMFFCNVGEYKFGLIAHVYTDNNAAIKSYKTTKILCLIFVVVSS